MDIQLLYMILKYIEYVGEKNNEFNDNTREQTKREQDQL
jgi:hypothetical protein